MKNKPDKPDKPDEPGLETGGRLGVGYKLFVMKHPFTLVKVGGAVVEDDARLDALLASFAAIDGRKVLVHGGGRRATAVARASAWRRRWSAGGASQTRPCSKW